MAENGGTIGRANVELGADTSKLEVGLTAAKAEVARAVGDMESQSAVGDDSAAYQQRLQEMAAIHEAERRAVIELENLKDRASRAERDRNKKTFNDFIAGVRAEREAVDDVGVVGTKASKNLNGIGSVGQSIKSATAGFRGLVSSITSTIGAAAGIVAIITTIASVVGLALKEIDSYFERLGQYRKALADVIVGYEKITKGPLRSPEATGEAAERRKVRALADERLQTVEELYNKESEAALKLSGEARENALANATYARNVATARIEKLYNDEIKLIVRNTRAKEDADKNAEHNSERAFKDSQKKIREADEKEQADRAQAEKDALDKLNAERRDSMQEYMEEWRDIQRENAKEQSAQMKAFTDQQRDQFAQLRGEINSLFNSGQLEIGINRLGALMEILVQKIGDQR